MRLQFAAWDLEVESDRTPDVQSDQRELGRRTPGELRGDVTVHPPHEVRHRLSLPSGFGSENLCDESEGEQGTESEYQYETSPSISKVELCNSTS